MNQLLPLSNDTVFIELDQNRLFYTYDRKIGIFDLTDQAVILEREVLEKSGKYRQCLPVRDRLYIKAFCDLHEFAADTLEPLRSWTLGENLSSDLNVIRYDDGMIYASIRNGNLAAIDLQSGEVRIRQITNTSMWDMIVYKDSIIAGNVNGELLQIDKATLTSIQIIQAHKKTAKAYW